MEKERLEYYKKRQFYLEIIVVIPTYNNADKIISLVNEVLMYAREVLVVDDGSTDNTLELLQGYGFSDVVSIISYPQNQGKGHALRVGLKAAYDYGFVYAITMDADGQHYPSDIPVFVDAIDNHPNTLFIGARNLASDNMPEKNTFANKFSNFWVKLETGITLTDTQSGYRAYPLLPLAKMHFYTTKYEYELEVLVRCAWRGIEVENIPIRVYYPPKEERISHFRPWRDFMRISVLNAILVVIALLWFWPLKFVRSINKENIHQFVTNNITHSKESNLKITLAAMLGIFMGIAPIWGYQMIAAGISAHFLRLNKMVAVLTSNISVPPMIPFILFGSYLTGGWILDLPVKLSLDTISFDMLKASFIQYLLGSIVFGVICSLIGGMLTFIVLSIFRKQKTCLKL